ncbi:hypothetical protein LINPERPRIM_LOCUS9395 [Linum perenne]
MSSISHASTSGSSPTRRVLSVAKIWTRSRATIRRRPLSMPSIRVMPMWSRATIEVFPITLSPSASTT